MVQGLFHYIFIKIPRWFSSLVSIQVTSAAWCKRADYQLHFAPPSSRKCVKAPLGCAVAGWLLAANPWCRKTCPCSPPYRTPPGSSWRHSRSSPRGHRRVALRLLRAAVGRASRGGERLQGNLSPLPPRRDCGSQTSTRWHLAAQRSMATRLSGKESLPSCETPRARPVRAVGPSDRTALGREALRTGVAARARRAGGCGDQRQDWPQLGRGSASRRKDVHTVPLLPQL